MLWTRTGNSLVAEDYISLCIDGHLATIISHNVFQPQSELAVDTGAVLAGSDNLTAGYSSIVKKIITIKITNIV